ncbi:uncharacterized protein [Antedon mediterranea]|uniref:uncharacterized protein n=1 Tax=Antedon mediterranea TaxID=105859 RepID=UPI003AF707C2
MTSSKWKIVGKNVAVKCPLFISFGHQTGIYTCQKDRLQYLVPTSNVQVIWFALQPKRVKLYCDNMKDIIEGEELNISCNMNRFLNIHYEVTIGWIQGKHNITQIHLTDTNTVTINQTLKGFHSGEGIFFYCILNNRYIYCYTLILTVHLQLKVDVKRLYSETPEVDVNQNCFKCYAEGGSGDKKIYDWSLNEEKLTGNDDQLETDERCFGNLPAGNYTVMCLMISFSPSFFLNILDSSLVEDNLPVQLS